MSRRFQFSLARLLATMVPVAIASLFLHFAIHFPAMGIVALAAATICAGWGAAIFFQNSELVFVVPVCLVILFVLLFVGA